MRKRAFLLALLSVSVVILPSCGLGNAPKGDVPIAQSVSEADLAPLEEATSIEAPSEEIVSSQASADSLGFIAYYPQKGTMGALSGTNQFTIYFQRPDVKAGLGAIELYDATNQQLVDTIEVMDESKCVISPIDESGMALTDWVEGTKAEIYFNKFFTPGASYYVLMDKGCFMAGEIASKGIDNASYMQFDVNEYGINGIFRDIYNFGDTANMDVVLGGDAVRAAILDYDGNVVNIPQSVFTAMGTNPFTVTFQSAGHATFRIAYYNAAGTEIDSITFNAEVLGTAGGAVYSDYGQTLVVEQDTPTDTATHVDVQKETAPAVNIQDNTVKTDE